MSARSSLSFALSVPWEGMLCASLAPSQALVRCSKLATANPAKHHFLANSVIERRRLRPGQALCCMTVRRAPQVAPDARYSMESGWPAGVNITGNDISAPFGGVLIGSGALSPARGPAQGAAQGEAEPPAVAAAGSLEAPAARPANASGVADVVVQGNRIAGAGSFAVLVTDADGVRVADNQVQALAGCGAGPAVGAGAYARASGPALYADRSSNVTFARNALAQGAPACHSGAAGVAALAGASGNTTGVAILT